LKLRDIAIVLLVLLVAGFAIGDAVWGDDPPPLQEASRAASTAAGPTPATPPLTRGETPRVPAAGTLAFTDAGDCRLRAAAVDEGDERELREISTSCQLWGPATGSRLAFGAPESSDALAVLEFVDLARPDEVTEGSGFIGPVVWTPDGERAAWCDSATSGYERLFATGDARRLPFCPRGYVDGQLARVSDRELVVGGRVVGAARHIEQVATGRRGEIGVVLEGGAVERIGPGGAATGFRLPGPALESELVFSPDVCAAAAVGAVSVTIVDLGCFRGRGQVVTVSTDNCINRREGPNAKCARYPAPRTFEGSAAAWSPDGRWLAVAEPRAIAFHRVVGGYRVIRWPARAADLAWVG
jgi:hypothetical protein